MRRSLSSYPFYYNNLIARRIQESSKKRDKTYNQHGNLASYNSFSANE